MKKIASIVSFLAVFVFVQINLSALDVQTDELKKGKRVVFRNYAGAERANPDISEVDKIGRTLARESDKTGQGKFMTKYSVIRAHSDEVNKLSADIFSIDRDSRVNHINMIRTILTSYYKYRFSYSKKEADILATVTTYYNAVYRGNVGYFSGIYRDVVISKINASNAGLSTVYSEWPGKTKILIPLGDNTNRADIFSLADDATTEEMRKAPDKNVPARNEIIKMKDAEIQKEKEENKKNESRLNEEKKQIAQKEKDVEQQKKVIQEEKKTVIEDKKRADEIKDPAERLKAKEDAAKKEQAVQKSESDVKKKEEAVAKEKQQLAEKEKAVEQKKADTEKKADSVVKEKEKVAEDAAAKNDTAVKQSDTVKPATPAEVEKKAAEVEKREQAVAKKEEIVAAKLDKIYKEKMYYLKVNNWFNDGIYNNEMYIINPLTRKVILKSKYQTIAGRKYDIFSKGIVVIGFQGKSGANYDHRLVILDPEKLTEIATGSDIVFWRSFVEVRDDIIYGVLSENGKFYLARFNDKLVKTGQSKVEIDKDSTISFYGDFIYLTSPDKLLLVFNKGDLSFLETINPEKDIEQ